MSNPDYLNKSIFQMCLLNVLRCSIWIDVLFENFITHCALFKKRKSCDIIELVKNIVAQLKVLCAFSEEKCNMQHLWSFYKKFRANWHWSYWKWRVMWHFLFTLFMWDSFLLFWQPFWISAWSICGGWKLTLYLGELIYLEKTTKFLYW